MSIFQSVSGKIKLKGYDYTNSVYRDIAVDANGVLQNSGGVSTFVGLSDTPGNYVGEAGKFVKVNATPDALAFATISVSDLPSAIDAAKIADGSVSNAEFQYLNSVTSSVQTQIDGKQPLDNGLTSLAGLVYVSDSFIKVTATDTYAIRTIAEIKTDLSLNNVENTALSGWAGTSNITTLGAIGTCASADIGGATNYIQIAAGGILTMQGSATIDGVAAGNLLDKSAAEIVTGIWTFSNISLVAIPGTDDTSKGIETDDINAGESIAFPNLVYLKSDGEWWKVDADAAATCQGLLGIALETKTDGNACRVLVHGFVRDDDWNWVVGGLIYASCTSGGLTQTAPSGTDDVIKIVGVATHADRIYFYPEMTVVTHT